MIRIFAVVLLLLGGAAAADPGDVLVADFTNHRVARFDAQGGFLDDFVPPQGGGLLSPHAMVWGPDQTGDELADLYVIGTGSNAVHLYDGQTGAPVGNGVFAQGSLFSPTDLIFGPDRSGDGEEDLYVLNFSVANRVVWFDGVDGTFGGVLVAQATANGYTSGENISFGPDSNGDKALELYATSAASGNVFRFDGVTGAFLDFFTTGGGLVSGRDLMFREDGRVYVGDGAGNQVISYDAATGGDPQVFVAPNAGGINGPHGIHFGPDVTGDGEDDFYVATEFSAQVTLHDGATGALVNPPFIGPGAGGLLYAAHVLIVGEADVEEGFHIDASTSGSWFPGAAHDGEGWLLEILSLPSSKDGAKHDGTDGLALAYWFTYPPEELVEKGLAPEQAWIFGVGEFHDDTIVVENAIITNGAVFGASFDPASVERSVWGDFSMQFDDDVSGTMAFAGPEGWGSGTLPMERITRLAGLPPGGAPAKVTDIGAFMSGSWFDPDHDGEGWLIEVLSDDLALVYWFSYDGNGNQAWFVGVGSIDGKTITVEDVLIPRGTVFGDDFDPGAVSLGAWGLITIIFDGCNSGTISYESSIPEFGSGSLQLVRITAIPGLTCEN